MIHLYMHSDTRSRGPSTWRNPIAYGPAPARLSDTELRLVYGKLTLRKGRGTRLFSVTEMIRALVLVTVLAASGLAEDESTHRRSSSIKQAASSRRDFALGPDDTEGQYCTDHGCDIPGSTISNPRTSDAAESEGFELDTVSDSSAQQWDVFSTIQDTLTSVKDTLLFNAYTKPLEFGKRVYNKATEYAEKVRTIFREEFSNFLEVIWETGVGTDPKSGKACTLLSLVPHLHSYFKQV